MLGYIRKYVKIFHVFVANRVKNIWQHTDPQQRRYIESKSDSEYLASRGVGARDLLTSDL